MEEGEEVVKAARRELQEESGLTVELNQMEKVGYFEYEFVDQVKVRAVVTGNNLLLILNLDNKPLDHGGAHLQGNLVVRRVWRK